MKSKLLATVAFATVVGLGGIAAAQSQMGGESNKSPSATQGRTGGSMSGSQSGSKTLSPSSSESGKSSGSSAQHQGMEKSGKDNDRLGQGATQEQKGTNAQNERGMQRSQQGAQEEGGMQRNQNRAQQERSMQNNQKGAREEQRNNNLKGAQEERGTTQRNATEQNGRNGVNTGANVEGRGQRGGSVQLSENQRSQIKTVIGREHGPRINNANFNVSVGTRIPHNVHVEVLPSDIVRIVPQYRGYRYFLYEDEIVIIDPRTFEIVAVIPA